MPRRSRVVVDDRRLRAVIRNAGPRARVALGNVAFAVERLAKQKAPVDTGALRASIYTVMPGESNEPPAVGGDGERVGLPAVGRGELVAHVGPSVGYGIYQELGTRFSAAQPFLLPALRAVEGEVPGYFREVVDGD